MRIFGGSRVGATVSNSYVYFAHDVTLFAYGVIYFQQRVTLEQNFMDPTYVKIEIQNEIWIVQLFLTKS